MAYHLVGDKSFRKGLNSYFKEHAYKNTVGADLWKALSDASGKDVASIMDPWIVTPGYPFVTVHRDDRDDITLHQQQLLTVRTDNHPKWPIPLWPNKRLSRIIFDTPKLKLNEPSALRLNTVGGHYVTKYEDPKDLNQLYKSVKAGSLSPHSRLFILHDLVLLAKCHQASLSDALRALSYYQHDKEESVWSVIQLAIADTRMIIEGDEVAEQKLKHYIWDLIQPNYIKLGWRNLDDDTANDKKLRSTIINLAIYSENPSALEKAQEIYNQNTDMANLPADIRSSVLAGLTKSRAKNVFMNLYKQYPSITQPDLNHDVAAALCNTITDSEINKLIIKFKDHTYIRHQDLERFVVYMLKNRFSRDQTWKWLVENWGWISRNFASDKSYDTYPRYAAMAFSTPKGLQRYKSLFDKLAKEPALRRNIDLGIKDIENKIEWRKADQRKVTDFILSL
jgi:aminopeptidase N